MKLTIPVVLCWISGILLFQLTKFEWPRFPLGLFSRTGFFPSGLQRRLRRGDRNATDLWNSGLFQLRDSLDDSLVFPRFLVHVWHVRLYSTYSDQLIADDITLNVSFRQSVVFPATNRPDPTQFPSETHLLKYDRFMATHIRAKSNSEFWFTNGSECDSSGMFLESSQLTV